MAITKKTDGGYLITDPHAMIISLIVGIPLLALAAYHLWNILR